MRRPAGGSIGSLAAFVLATGLLVAQQAPSAPPPDPRDIDAWVEQLPPRASDKPGGVVWEDALRIPAFAWRVFLEDGKVLAELLDPRVKEPEPQPPFVVETKDISGPTAFCQVDDGWLVAFNHGEFGGALYWFSADGAQNYRISDHRVEAFLQTPGGVLAIEGIAHGGLSQGSLIRIARPEPGARWLAPTLLTLPAAPVAVARRADGMLFIVLSDGVASVDPSDRLHVLFRDQERMGLSRVRSCVLSSDGNRLYFGMGDFVGQVKLDAAHLTLLVPDADFLQAATGSDVQQVMDRYGPRPKR